MTKIKNARIKWGMPINTKKPVLPPPPSEEEQMEEVIDRLRKAWPNEEDLPHGNRLRSLARQYLNEKTHAGRKKFREEVLLPEIRGKKND